MAQNSVCAGIGRALPVEAAAIDKPTNCYNYNYAHVVHVYVRFTSILTTVVLLLAHAVDH